MNAQLWTPLIITTVVTAANIANVWALELYKQKKAAKPNETEEAQKASNWTANKKRLIRSALLSLLVGIVCGFLVEGLILHPSGNHNRDAFIISVVMALAVIYLQAPVNFYQFRVNRLHSKLLENISKIVEIHGEHLGLKSPPPDQKPAKPAKPPKRSSSN